MDRLNLSLQYERAFECMKWMHQLPYFPMKHGWQIKVLPVVCGSIIRFWIRTEKMKPDDHLSLYFDAYETLGFMREPYYELYDGKETYRFLENEQQHLFKKIEEIVEMLEKK